MRTLWIYAAPREGEALQGRGLETLELGVGKVASTLSLTRRLCAGEAFDRVLCVGVAGSYPARHRQVDLPALAVGSVCLVGEEYLIDEGVETPDGFLGLEDLGFGSRGPIRADSTFTDDLARQLGVAVVGGATVSTCSGTDALSRARAAAAPVSVETMEGAGLATVCAGLGLSFAQLRTISNETGDRSRSRFDLDMALAALHTAIQTVMDGGLS